MADLARNTKTRTPAALLATLATLTLVATTACSTDKKPTTPKISQAAPKSSAAPLPSASQVPSALQSSVIAPPVSTSEAEVTSQKYFDLSRQVKSAHDIAGLSDIEDGTMLEISKARQQRILKYGDNLPSSEEQSETGSIKTATPQASPPGADRWILSTGQQTLSGKSRSSLGVLRQSQGAGPWKMFFLAFTNVNETFPAVTQISTKSGAVGAGPDDIDYGDQVCKDYAGSMNGDSASSKWGTRATGALQSFKNEVKESESLTKGGKAEVHTEARDSDRTPAWRTSDGGKLVMCTTYTTTNLTAGTSGVITITRSSTFQNLSGRTTQWKTLSFVNVGMRVFKVPPASGSPIEIVGEASRPLSVDGTPA